MTQINITATGNIVFIEGSLVRSYLSKNFVNKTCEFFDKNNIIIDLSKVKKIDTAGLAWLLLLVEQASKNSFSLQFTHLPSKLLSLAKLSAVDLFLPQA